MRRARCGWPWLLLVLVPLPLHADDWPQFRGPARDGVSREKGLLKSWPKEGPRQVWSFKNAGLGFSSFAVADGKLYTLGTRDQDEIILALDAKSGQELWTARIGPIFTFKGNIWGDGPRGTPTVEGNLLYALGGHGDLVCVDLSQKGKEIWRKHLVKELGGELMSRWGYSESPLVDGKQLICTPGGKDGTLAALDKQTGAVIWRSQEWTETAPYSSPIAADIHGVRQYIQNGYTGGTKGGSIAGVEARTGKVLWKQTIFQGDSYAIGPTPTVKGNQVYMTSGMDGVGCHLFEIGAKQAATEKYSKKTQKLVKNSHGGVVLIGDFIYCHSEKERWICQELATGELKWDQKEPLSCTSAAIAAADGMLYLFTDEGEVGLAEATPEAFKVVSSFTLPERSKLPGTGTAQQSKPWAYPVVANGLLLVRDHDLIFAFDVRGK